MTPVRQTLFSNPDDPDAPPGNCLQAAVASLLDLPLDEVPHFVGIDVAGGLHWWTHMRRWFRERGWSLRTGEPPAPGVLYLGGGPSPRANGGELHHVALYRDGVLVHDPHPDGLGVVEVTSRWTIHPIDKEG